VALHGENTTGEGELLLDIHSLASSSGAKFQADY